MTNKQNVRALVIKEIEVYSLNQRLNVRMELEGPRDYDTFIPQKDQAIAVPEEGGEFRYGLGSNGVVSFGFWSYEESQRPDHGGLWSSNSRVFNELVKDIQVTEVAINHMGVAIDVTVLQEILNKFYPGQYLIHPEERFGSSYYRIHDISVKVV